MLREHGMPPHRKTVFRKLQLKKTLLWADKKGQEVTYFKQLLLL